MPCFESPEMLEAARVEGQAARARTADWMARMTLRNMLHVDPGAADPHGGPVALTEKLAAAYSRTLGAD